MGSDRQTMASHLMLCTVHSILANSGQLPRLTVAVPREIFYSLAEARVLIETWRRHYNTVRPHSSLGYRPTAPEAVPSPVPPSSSASLHLRATLAMEVTMR